MRKEITKSLAITMFLLLFSSFSIAQSLLLQCGWENAEAKWSTSAGAGRVTSSSFTSTNKLTGTYALRYSLSGTNPYGRIYSPGMALTIAKTYAIYWVKAVDATNTWKIDTGWGAVATPLSSGTAVTLSNNTWTQITSTYGNTSANKAVCPTFGSSATVSVGADSLFIDNVVVYQPATVSDAIDLASPSKPTFGSCTTSQLNWTNGVDYGGASGSTSSIGATGLGTTILLKTTNLSATAPTLQNQAPYSANQIIGTDWTVVDPAISKTAINYSISISQDTKYAIYHRDFVFNYSTAETVTVAVCNTPYVLSLTSAVGTDTQAPCLNSAITNITYSLTNGSGASVTGLPTGVSGAYSSGTVTISGTPSVSGNFSYTVTPMGGCGLSTATGTINIKSVTTNPTITSTLLYNGGTSVSGTSLEADGTSITVYKNGNTSIGSATVASGAWTSSVSTLTTGDAITATATATGKCVSSASNSITVASNSNPTLGWTSGITTQTVSAGSAIGSIVYTWGGSATSASVAWSGSSATTPSGISQSSNGGAKTLTLSGTPSVAGTYNYSVTSTDGSTTSSASTGSLTVKLATPDLSSGASSVTNQGFTAQWAAVSGVTNYTVKVYQGITEVIAARQTGVTGTSVAISGLSSNTSYIYKVTAIGDGSQVPNSDESSASATVRTLNTAKAITAFNITGQQTSSIDENAKTVTVYVPVGTDKSTLSPTITVSANASVSPGSGVSHDFTSPVQYTVTAEDGSQQAYTVTVAYGTSATDYFRSKASGVWSSASTWESSSDNSSWMNATLYPTKASQGVSITGGRLISYTLSDSIPTTTINATDTLKAYASVLVAAGKNLTVNGVYIHNLNAGTIPNTSSKNTISWATGSTMMITGVTAAAPTGIDQDFYNFIWNCTSQNTAIGGIWGDGRHIKGNVTITSTGATGTNYLRFMSMSAGVTKKIIIDGNLSLNGYVTTNGSSGSGIAEIEVYGNTVLNSGCTFLLNNGSGASPCIFDLHGNFTINSGATLSSKTPATDAGTFNFMNTGAQSFANSGTFNSSLGAITVNVNNGSSLTLSNNLKANVLNVNPGAKLTNNAALTVTTFNLQSDATGTGTYLETGSSTITTVNAKQYLTTGRNWYISSPVTGATATTFNPAGLSNIMYWYDEVHGSTSPWPQITDNATGLNVMQGYVVNMATDGAVTFNGTLNNGSKNITVSRTNGQAKEGFNLVGNPYPSYLDWDQVTKSNLQTSMWQRTKNSGDTYVFDIYNSTGQLAINNSGKNITNHIPPMQAFWVRVDNGFSFGSITANNTMRSHAGSQNAGLGSVTDPVFKTPAQVQSVVRLQISTGANTDEAVIYSNDNALNSFDAFDSPKMFNNSVALAEIYTLAGSEDVAINGFGAIPYDNEIALGFSTLSGGTFGLKASQIINLQAGTQVILKDYINANNPVVADLTDGSVYSFSSDATSNNTSRFSIMFHAPSIATGINNSGSANVWVSTNAAGQVMINGAVDGQTKVEIFNAIGQRILSKNLTTAGVLDNRLASGIYSIALTNAGKTETLKVIIK